MRKQRGRALRTLQKQLLWLACFEFAFPGLAPEEDQRRAPQQGRFSLASPSKPFFARKWKTTAGKTTRGSPKPPRGYAEQARAREEPSPGPPASETDATPLGHQPHGEILARPRLNCGAEAPAEKSERVANFAILAPTDWSSEADLEACKTYAELKNKLREAPTTVLASIFKIIFN